jgi:hypothetical protein
MIIDGCDWVVAEHSVLDHKGCYGSLGLNANFHAGLIRRPVAYIRWISFGPYVTISNVS